MLAITPMRANYYGMGEFIYRLPGKNVGFSPEIIDTVWSESISLFDVKPGAQFELDLSFDEDGGKKGKVVIRVDQAARKEDWDRGSFTVVYSELSFTPSIGDVTGRTGYVDAAIDFRPGDEHVIGLGKVAHISKGRSLVMNFDIPGKPDLVHRWIPFILDYRELPPSPAPATELSKLQAAIGQLSLLDPSPPEQP